MNREIKLKLWLPTISKMSYALSIKDWANGQEIAISDNCVWFQYTGLKDKNGKEIYEGDIVKDGATIFKIVWYKGRFDFERISGAYQSPYFGDNCSRMEIIGNIHENPDLLK